MTTTITKWMKTNLNSSQSRRGKGRRPRLQSRARKQSIRRLNSNTWSSYIMVAWEDFKNSNKYDDKVTISIVAVQLNRRSHLRFF
ncbi:hypothetical protein BCR33DRAFT_528119 [Rhizoclosmatium globosum]|uniref:Uncharacterized protein n=1 Tax=Rhizoclosmatium globosum TaxID=329046 RepID=A0A1Y2CU64_9FUNG|nr:hypothetical protein BCR33DRAFT_528119 [Rhizoclosmatium globosum]|eukprot:ORY50374.1 hypothetical protein BCR33DRAFT_528119 [Rhizoclosmatium globosum]